jgi:hypothetical protein
MIPNENFILRTGLSPDIVKFRLKKLNGIVISNNNYDSKERLTSISDSPMLGNMALLNGKIMESNSETVLKVNVKLHYIGLIAILIGLAFGAISILLAIFKSSFSELVGLIPLGVLYPLVLFNYYADSNIKINELKQILELK